MMTLIVYSVGFAGTKKNNKQIKASPSLYNKANFPYVNNTYAFCSAVNSVVKKI